MLTGSNILRKERISFFGCVAADLSGVGQSRNAGIRGRTARALHSLLVLLAVLEPQGSSSFKLRCRYCPLKGRAGGEYGCSRHAVQVKWREARAAR